MHKDRDQSSLGRKARLGVVDSREKPWQAFLSLQKQLWSLDIFRQDQDIYISAFT